jgi:predicted DNA-binding transcriptional regulator AlpA
MTMHQLPVPAAAPMPRPVLRAGEVADLLGYRCTASFYSRREALEAAGFPPRLPGVNGWSRAAILRWIDSNGASYAPRPGEPGIAAEAAALEGEYAR